MPGITGEQKQDAYMAKCECCFGQGDFVGVVASLKKGIEMAPNSDQAKRFKDIIENFQPMADVQETIVKLKPDLEKAKGLDRAKILDKLIDAWETLQGRTREMSSAQTEKWSHEILTLDADNKAGLKVKYEFRRQMADARKLQANATAYRAAIEKALALPGLAGEQIQVGRFALAISYLSGNDLKNGLDQMQKAVDAAPESRRGKMIKGYLDRMKPQLEAAKAKKAAKPEK